MATVKLGLRKPDSWWTGAFVLSGLSQGTQPRTGFPAPIVPRASVSLQYGLSAYVSLEIGVLNALSEPEVWSQLRQDWWDHWGMVTNGPNQTHFAVLAVRVTQGGVTASRELYGYGWYREWDDEEDAFGEWAYYGPVGGGQSVDSFIFNWSLGLTGTYLGAEWETNPPAYRARQDVSDDKLSYTGLFVPAATTAAYTLSGMSGAIEDLLETEEFMTDVILGVGLSYSGADERGTTPTIGTSAQGVEHIGIWGLECSAEELTHLTELNSVTENGSTWTNYRDGIYPDTSRYLVQGHEGSKIGLQRLGAAITSGANNAESLTWGGSLYEPLLLQWNWEPRQFDNDEAFEGLLLDVGLLNGDGETPVYLSPGLSAKYHIPRYSWHNYTADYLTSTALRALLTPTYLDSIDENPQTAVSKSGWPSDPEVILHDRLVPYVAWPVPADDYEQTPWFGADPEDNPVLSIAQAATVNLDVPPGLAEAPSAWQGENGLTPDEVNANEWQVEPDAGSPTAYRELETRYYTQMDLLGSAYGAEYPRVVTWPRWLRANLEQEPWLDMDEEDPEHVAIWASITKPEDVANWSNYSYLGIVFSGDRWSTPFKVRLTYSTATYFDPCYQGFQGRFGPDGEWSWSRTSGLTATYTHDRDGQELNLADGTAFTLDLACPTEGGVPKLEHVDKIEFIFEDAPGTSQTLTLSALQLQQSNREGEVPHLRLDSKRAWNYAANYFGVGWSCDGLHNAQTDWYGTGRFQNEYGLAYLQHEQMPYLYSGPPYDPTWAYPLSQLPVEINRHEGLTASLDSDAWAYWTEDEEENSIGSPAWWWIREHPDLAMDDYLLELGVVVGTLDISHARGVPMLFQLRKHLRGKPAGIARWKHLEARARNAAGVQTYWRETAEGQETDWAVLGTSSTDIHGRYRGANCAEDGGADDHAHDRSRQYRVGPDWELGAATARSYWVEGITLSLPGTRVAMAVDAIGIAWIAAIEGGAVNVYSLEPGAQSVPEFHSTALAEDCDYPGIACADDGALYVSATREEGMVYTRSRDRAHTWEEITTATLGADLIQGGIAYRDGTLYTCGWAADGQIRMAASSRQDLVRDQLTFSIDWKPVVAQDEAIPSAIQVGDSREILVAVMQPAGIEVYRCRDLGTDFALVE